MRSHKMKWLACVLLFLFEVHGHVPDSPDNPNYTQETAYEIGDVIGKSWGIYVGADQPTWYALQGKQGQRLSLSVSTTINPERRGLVDVKLYGPGVETVTCTEHWNGWSSRRLSNMSFAPPGYGTPEFEPFGVGGYIPLTACNSTFPSTATYYVEVRPVHNRSVYFTIGAGMAESFSFVDILTISYKLLQTYQWSGQSVFLVVGPMVVCVMAWGILTALKVYEPSPWRVIAVLGTCMCIASPIIFMAQLVYVAHYSVHMGSKVAIPCILHIGLPLALNTYLFFGPLQIRTYASPMLNRSRRIFIVGGGLLQCFITWQSYLLGPVLLVLSGCWYTPQRYSVIPS